MVHLLPCTHAHLPLPLFFSILLLIFSMEVAHSDASKIPRSLSLFAFFLALASHSTIFVLLHMHREVATEASRSWQHQGNQSNNQPNEMSYYFCHIVFLSINLSLHMCVMLSRRSLMKPLERRWRWRWKGGG